MRSNKINYVCILLFCLIFSACKPKYYFEAYENIPDQEWLYSDSINFTLEVDDNDSFYDIYILIRHKIDYPWMNLWLKIKTTSPDKNSNVQRVELPMSDAKGKWYGSGISALKLNEVSISQKYKFKATGIYHFSLIQDMRYEPVKEISDIGLRIEKRIE